MRDVKAEFNVAMVAEVPGPAQIEMMRDVADMFQVGAPQTRRITICWNISRTPAGRSSQTRQWPVTVEEWLTAAEYWWSMVVRKWCFASAWLRSFDKATRNLLDLEPWRLLVSFRICRWS